MKHEVIVQKMIAYTEKVINYCAGMDYAVFSADTRLAEACVFNLSQLGALANRVEESFAKEHPEIPWKDIYGLRNRIVHDYEDVNLLLIWEIIHDDLPQLRDQLLKI